jgi:hypothetical protein
MARWERPCAVPCLVIVGCRWGNGWLGHPAVVAKPLGSGYVPSGIKTKNRAYWRWKLEREGAFSLRRERLTSLSGWDPLDL